MKKITLIAAVAIAVLSTSCKKDRVCTCTVTPVSGTGSTYTVTYFKAKKGDARLLCTAQATEQDVTAPTSIKGDKTTCTLK